jgi:hypothetical protein
MMNYITAVAQAIAERCGDPSPTPADERLYLIYAVLALTTGEATTSEHVHDAWSAWRTTTMPDHWSLVPFDELAPPVAVLDDEYAEAIRGVATDYRNGAIS